MTHPAWLSEFHRRWHAARDRTVGPPGRDYGLKWSALLEAAGITSAEDEHTALREAEALARAGHFLLKRHRARRYIVERIVLPLDQESWLHATFGSRPAAEILAQAQAVLARQPSHPRFAGPWQQLLDRLAKHFAAGSTLPPFRWRDPEGLSILLDTLHGLTAREWEPGTRIRRASSEVAPDSKWLGRHQLSLAQALEILLGKPTTLADLGLAMSEAILLTQGPLILHFDDGSRSDSSALSLHGLSAVDLQRAVRLETSCRRLLIIENEKTTLRQFAEKNRDGETLLVASSFPTPAMRALLKKLPQTVELHHFGDTDPTGFLILENLRQLAGRPVHAFHMDREPRATGPALTPRDQLTLDRLIESEVLEDLRPALLRLKRAGHKGGTEQEELGPPETQGWPFYPMG
ncbi:Wadjet anti-phage system protein JetD domain-containing protein [Haloferula sargassicola]|uniref:Wadjet protein JetD C-terminal domain-containing protein n=1 Tax=Haloferula sargassicola TaxID=490096 RepID=A0ABP9UNT2_9BACT